MTVILRPLNCIQIQLKRSVLERDALTSRLVLYNFQYQARYLVMQLLTSTLESNPILQTKLHTSDSFQIGCQMKNKGIIRSILRLNHSRDQANWCSLFQKLSYLSVIQLILRRRNILTKKAMNIKVIQRSLFTRLMAKLMIKLASRGPQQISPIQR